MSEIETKPEKPRRKVGWFFLVLALITMCIKYIWNGFRMPFKELIEWIMGILMASGFAS